jgi:hypothetical protein
VLQLARSRCSRQRTSPKLNPPSHTEPCTRVRRALPTRRAVLRWGALAAGSAAFLPHAYAFQRPGPGIKLFDVASFGAAGDGLVLDTAAIQRAIDAAAAYHGRARVLLRRGRKYLTGTIELKSNIDFHLEGGSELIVSTRPKDYRGGLAGSQSADTMAGAAGAVLVATGARGLTISGSGTIQGRAREFMARYDTEGEIWVPGPFRPKMFVLTECRDLEVRDISFAEAPNWGLHMLGCEQVLVDSVKIRNLLDVPNCDGIDPDHCRDVEIRDCDITSGDDGIVIKTSRQAKDYGPCANIRVADCTITTQDAGLKIGTETTADIHDIRFENCTVLEGSRGLCIQLRDQASIYNIDFRGITFRSRYFADPWWGRGEGISFTALPRTEGAPVGSLHHVTVSDVSGSAENSIRIEGYRPAGETAYNVHDITFDHVHTTLERTTDYPGALFDNRPTKAVPPIEPHDAPGFSIEHAQDVTLRSCLVTWGENVPDSFTYAVEAKDAPGLKLQGLQGGPAHSALGKAVSIS